MYKVLMSSALVLGMTMVAPEHAAARVGAGSFAVTQKNLQFNPGELTVAVGDTVTWTNHETDGSTIHSVVQQGGSEINSPDIPAETSFSWTFTQVADYNIICRFHPDMFMTLHVTEAKAAKGAKGKDAKAADAKAKDTKSTAKKPKKSKKKAAPAHGSHADSTKKSIPAAPPGAPESTIPGIAGLPISPERDYRR